ncbi:hypothetical protein ABD91_25980 [Lysinibacillus sphaericus]|uniref:hypothetical protein n=1 Tax=Lysinibacillus sphaericus TaxID=1421 RepID=UPI0018CD7BCD|nr:hypothetical protein [Lysinibacillus sphaericus]MBG9694183.1 hypothetical protein [Lysinibacillus sphaericus]
MDNNTQTKQQLDVFYTSVEQRKSEVVKNLILFTIIGLANIIGTFIAVSKLGYYGFYFLLIAFIAFFIGFFQFILMVKLKNGTEQAVWEFAERPQTYTTNYQVGFSEKILSLRSLETVVLNQISPTICRVKVLSSIKNSITKKYTFKIDLSLDQIELFCKCLTKHGIEQHQIRNYVHIDQSPPAFV